MEGLGPYEIGPMITVDEKLWWLSFADPVKPVGTQFLGAVLVRAFFFTEAAAACRVLGINPGGEVIGREVPEGCMSDFWPVNKLLSREEIEALDARQLFEGKPASDRDLAKNPERATGLWEVSVSDRRTFS